MHSISLCYCLSFYSFSCSVLLIPQFASLEKAEEIQEFFASRTNSKIARTLKQSIERVHINAYRAQGFRIELQNHLAPPFEQNSVGIRRDFPKIPSLEGYCPFLL